MMRPPRITGIRPLWALEGGCITIDGTGFQIDPVLPDVRIGDVPARVVSASSRALRAIVPAGVMGASTVRVENVPGETLLLDVGAPIASGIHQVDNPVFDADGNLYVTFSGGRDSEAPVSIFRVTRDGVREPFLSGISNPTSMAFDREGRLYVSSRFEGIVFRVNPGGHAESVASELGTPCGLAIDPEGRVLVGDRSGTVFRVDTSGRVEVFASLPPSVAAFHLALSPDGDLYVAAPTISPIDRIYRIDPGGTVHTLPTPFGRPQGLAFDAQRRLHVVEAVAGGSGVYRLDPDGTTQHVVAGDRLIGLAFDPGGGLVVASNDTIYRLDVPARGRAVV